MATINIEVAGDNWINRDSVIGAIKACCDARYIVFEVNTEGPSLHALGIVDAIVENIDLIGLKPDQVWIDCWHNTVEHIPFRRAYRPKLSHFFWMSESYRSGAKLPSSEIFPLAFFVGRLTHERAVMLWDTIKFWPSKCLTSLMTQSGHVDLMVKNGMSPWIDADQLLTITDWIKRPPIASITGHSVRDQYMVGNDTNRCLIAHYDRFGVELVAETYCQGETFFPTEKTVRPLSQGKPVLVYGPRHFLARLRDLGFRTWHDIWDESYDDMIGYDRWKSISATINRMLIDKSYAAASIKEIGQHNIQNLDRLIEKYAPQ